LIGLPRGSPREFRAKAHIASVGAYASINDLLYLELSAYKSLNFNAQNSLGINPFDGPGLLGGVAPYWRVALEPHWGRHSLMVGTFGMYFDVHPWLDPTFVSGTTGRFRNQTNSPTSASTRNISIRATTTG